MTAKNNLTTAPPYAVDSAIKVLGANLRTARLRRGISIQEISEKIGTGPRAVADAERGKPSTAIVVYMGLLWALDMIDQLQDVASPAADTEGLALSTPRQRARRREELDNDF